MLVGGTGDQNLEPLKGDDVNLPEMLSRVRSLLAFSVENRGAKLEMGCKNRRAEMMIESWKNIFSKFDKNCTGNFQLEAVRNIVRRELKIADRLVTDDHLNKLFDAVDTDRNGIISCDEFLDFVQQPSLRGSMSEDAVVNAVARGVRLALRRNKIQINELQETFYTFDESGDIATGELGPNDMIRFFRKVLKLAKHESSDKALRIAFYAMDEDGSGKMSLEELMDFIKFCSQVGPSTGTPLRVKGLIAGMSGQLPPRIPSRRPGSMPGASMTHLPFCLNGRDISSAGRLAQTTQRGFLTRADSEPSLPSLGMRSTQPNIMSKTFSPSSLIIRDACSEPGDDESPTSAGRVSFGGPCKEKVPKKRVWSGQLPGKTHGGYMLLKGAHALNQVEERLFEAGIDVRGHYHKLGRDLFRPVL